MSHKTVAEVIVETLQAAGVSIAGVCLATR
jgi:hypothetical protein